MKKFKYSHSLTVNILCIAITLITAVGCFFGIKTAINVFYTFDRIMYILLSVIGLFLFALSFGAVVYSRYIIKDNKLYIRLGLTCEKIRLDEVLSLVHIIDQKKLALTFSEDKYLYIVIKPEDIEDFVAKIKEQNPSVIYEVVYSPVENKKND